MKRFSIFCAALFAAATSFATVAYELNGGVQSTYLTPQDMYADLNVDYNAATGATATWVSLAECTATKRAAKKIENLFINLLFFLVNKLLPHPLWTRPRWTSVALSSFCYQLVIC